MANESIEHNAQQAPETIESIGANERGAHHEGGFPPFQTENFAPQLVWLVLIFGALYLLMSRVALPRVGAILENRDAKISADLDAAREMQAKAQAAAKANDENLRLRREEAQGIGREAQAKIAADMTARRIAAEADAAEKIRAAEARIASAKNQALANVEGIAVDAAHAIVEKLTGVTVDKSALSAAFQSIKN
ncbi:MAG: ATPase [Methylocystis sp.]|nr:ATPase [Methylocystis sp.]